MLLGGGTPVFKVVYLDHQSIDTARASINGYKRGSMVRSKTESAGGKKAAAENVLLKRGDTQKKKKTRKVQTYVRGNEKM